MLGYRHSSTVLLVMDKFVSRLPRPQSLNHNTDTSTNQMVELSVEVHSDIDGNSVGRSPPEKS